MGNTCHFELPSTQTDLERELDDENGHGARRLRSRPALKLQGLTK